MKKFKDLESGDQIFKIDYGSGIPRIELMNVEALRVEDGKVTITASCDGHTAEYTMKADERKVERGCVGIYTDGMDLNDCIIFTRNRMRRQYECWSDAAEIIREILMKQKEERMRISLT